MCLSGTDGNICNRSLITSDGSYSVLHRTNIQIPALNEAWTKEAARNNEEKEPPYVTSAAGAPNLPGGKYLFQSDCYLKVK